MSTIATIPDMTHYRDIVHSVVDFGEKSSPRGIVTRETLGSRVVIANPTRNFASDTGRGLVRNIAHIEAVQLVGGFSSPKMLTEVSPRFRDFMDNDTFWGAYGNRIGSQVVDVVRKLQDDPQSRQAVITLWDPDLDNVQGKHDYPCTIMFQFMIRGRFHNELWMFTTMRSNDVWLGFPYDVFQFTMLQCSIANALSITPGPYVHTANSLHLYETDDVHTDKLRLGTIKHEYTGFGRPGMSIEEILERAYVIGTSGWCENMTPSEARVAQTVSRFR